MRMKAGRLDSAILPRPGLTMGVGVGAKKTMAAGAGGMHRHCLASGQFWTPPKKGKFVLFNNLIINKPA
jgi:hypothetical protein